MTLPDISLPQLLQRVAGYLIVVGVYGLVTTWLARRAGDEGPTHDGRLTANPLVHLDILALLASVFFRVAWTKPLDVDATAFRRPRLASAVIVVGSSVGAIAFGAVCLVLRPYVQTLLGGNAAIAVSGLLLIAFEMSVMLAILNLLPIPPLTGTLWAAVASPGAHRLLQDRRSRLAGSGLIALALLVGLLTPPLRVGADAVRRALGY